MFIKTLLRERFWVKKNDVSKSLRFTNTIVRSVIPLHYYTIEDGKASLFFISLRLLHFRRLLQSRHR